MILLRRAETAGDGKKSMMQPAIQRASPRLPDQAAAFCDCAAGSAEAEADAFSTVPQHVVCRRWHQPRTRCQSRRQKPAGAVVVDWEFALLVVIRDSCAEKMVSRLTHGRGAAPETSLFGLPSPRPRPRSNVLAATPQWGHAGGGRATPPGGTPQGCRQAGTAQLTFTSICFGRAFSLLARCTRNTPSLNSALTLSASASSGMVKLRSNRP